MKGAVWLLCSWMLAGWSAAPANPANAPRLENDVLRIDLSLADAALTVVDKRIDLTWRQKVQPGFHIAPETLRVSPSRSLAGSRARAKPAT